MKKQVTIYNRFTDSSSRKRGWDPNQYLSISNIYKYLFLILFAVIHVRVAESQVLEKYIEEAIENNPALQASFKSYEASLQKSNQVSLENPQLNIGVFTRPMELLMGNQRAEASVMQMFP